MNGNGKRSGTKVGDGIKAQRSREIEERLEKADSYSSMYLLGELDYLSADEWHTSYREKEIATSLGRLKQDTEELFQLGIKGESYEVLMLSGIIFAAENLLRFSGAEYQRRDFEWKPMGCVSDNYEE